MPLNRDSRGDVVIAARLRPGKHDAEIEWLDRLAGENPDATVQDIIVWLINKARGESYNLAMPYDERYAQEALKRVDQRTHHLEELVSKLVGQIRAGGGQVQEAEFSPDDRALLQNMERAAEDGAGEMGEFSL